MNNVIVQRLIETLSNDEREEFDIKYKNKINQITRELEEHSRERLEILDKEHNDIRKMYEENKLENKKYQKELDEIVKEFDEMIKLDIDEDNRLIEKCNKEKEKINEALSKCETIADMCLVDLSFIDVKFISLTEVRECLLNAFLNVLSKQKDDTGEIADLLIKMKENI